MDSPETIRCPNCQARCHKWITTCPECEITIDRGESNTSLAAQVAPALNADTSWIDIPVSSDEPVKVALLTSFLQQRRVVFHRSMRFVSVPSDSVGVLVTSIGAWAMHNDLIDDSRHLDSLSKTMAEIGAAVLWAIDDFDGTLSARIYGQGIDLR